MRMPNVMRQGITFRPCPESAIAHGRNGNLLSRTLQPAESKSIRAFVSGKIIFAAGGQRSSGWFHVGMKVTLCFIFSLQM
jgi:hypothetical protein